MSFFPLIRMPGTSLGPCMLVHAAYGHVEAAGLRSDYPTQFGVRARIGLGSRVTRIGSKESGSDPDFSGLVANFWFRPIRGQSPNSCTSSTNKNPGVIS